jgi:hypothetical protein
MILSVFSLTIVVLPSIFIAWSIGKITAHHAYVTQQLNPIIIGFIGLATILVSTIATTSLGFGIGFFSCIYTSVCNHPNSFHPFTTSLVGLLAGSCTSIFAFLRSIITRRPQ